MPANSRFREGDSGSGKRPTRGAGTPARELVRLNLADRSIHPTNREILWRGRRQRIVATGAWALKDCRAAQMWLVDGSGRCDGCGCPQASMQQKRQRDWRRWIPESRTHRLLLLVIVLVVLLILGLRLAR
jgi:hypothetical protein